MSQQGQIAEFPTPALEDTGTYFMEAWHWPGGPTLSSTSLGATARDDVRFGFEPWLGHGAKVGQVT